MDWKYCSNQFTLCIIPHTNRKSFCSGYYFQIIYLYEQLLYGWPLYKMHKELFDTLLKGPNHLLPFFSFCQQKNMNFTKFLFFKHFLKYWRIEESGCLGECKIYASILTFSIVKRTQPNKYLHIRREKNPSASFWERLGM